jgi:MFS family permease
MALDHHNVLELGISSGIFGVGLGFAYAALTSLIVQNVPAAQTGVAMGMNSNVRTIGGAFGAAVMTAIVTAQHQPGGLPAEQGFTAGFLLFGGIAVVALLVALMIPPLKAPEGRPVASPA